MENLKLERYLDFKIRNISKQIKLDWNLSNALIHCPGSIKINKFQDGEWIENIQ